jgi:hypothetical protein
VDISFEAEAQMNPPRRKQRGIEPSLLKGAAVSQPPNSGRKICSANPKMNMGGWKTALPSVTIFVGMHDRDHDHRFNLIG